MSNASLKEQLEAMTSKFSQKVNTEKTHESNIAKSTEIKKKNHSAEKIEKLQKPKPRWLDYVQYGVELLKAYFPHCFKEGNAIQPLKKGIKEDLVKELSTLEQIVTEDKACMVRSLSYYVNTITYHKAVIAGATRIDLQGQAAGVVSAEEAKYSTERQLAKVRGKQVSTPASSHHPEKTLS